MAVHRDAMHRSLDMLAVAHVCTYDSCRSDVHEITRIPVVLDQKSMKSPEFLQFWLMKLP